MRPFSFLLPRHLAVPVAVAAVLLSSSTAHAQQASTLRWQLQPFCNVLTLSIVQEGSSFLLTGTDDGCGQGPAAPATGTAIVNADGSIAFGLIVITPNGAAEHLNAALNPATFSGTWRDADGRAGAFRFNPGATTGGPRPGPTTSSVITSAQLAASIFSGSGQATTVSRSDHTHDDRYYTKSQVDAVVAAGGAEVIEGPGIRVPSTLVAQFTQGTFDERVTTSTDGRLLVTKAFNGTVVCPGAGGVFFFLLVDDRPIRNSAVFGIVDFAGQLTGVTPDVVPAGAHLIRLGAQCAESADGPTSSSVKAPTISSVIVLPS